MDGTPASLARIEPDDHLTYLFARVAHRLQRGIDDALRSVPISLTQFSALAHIGRRPEIALSELARALLTTPQAATTLARRLERDGHVHLHSEGAGLPIRITLTAQGAGVLAESATIATEAEDDLLSHLGSETRSELAQLLKSMLPEQG